MLSSLILATVFVAAANAQRTITLQNDCPWAVTMVLSNFPNDGAAYTGPAIPSIAAGTSWNLVVPTGWNGKHVASVITLRAQDVTTTASEEVVAFGEAACSMTEWTFDSANLGGQTDYDISNIQGFSVAQEIIPQSGETVICTSVDCACDQAYRPGDTSGTCGGTGPVDQATRVGASAGYTVVYCP
ncbi:hypothetical protein K438DRAFT_1977726 [Mycena galopus ATCC 62051]|nr:hypothetical protein K438DRAFT_1977726 [Mycena galopus ATCC 62051]